MPREPRYGRAVSRGASSVWATNRRSGTRCRKLPNTMSGALRLCRDGTVRPSQNSAADRAGEGHHRRLTPPLVAGRHPSDAGGIGIAFGDVHRAQRRERLVRREPVVEGHVQHRMTLIDGVQPERRGPAARELEAKRLGLGLEGDLAQRDEGAGADLDRADEKRAAVGILTQMRR